MSRWRARVGDEGAEWLLTRTIEAGCASGVVKDKTLSRVCVDTTVMEKNIAYPTSGRGKVYAPHESDVDCIPKGKARVRYEFGTKVNIATTIEEGFVVGRRAMPGNPYDGHILAEALEQLEILTDQCPSLAIVDRGYRGHDVEKTKVRISAPSEA